MSEGKSKKSISVFNLIGQPSVSRQGTYFKNAEPLSAEMLTNESRYLIDMIGSHQLLPTMESGLIGKLEWNEGEPKWSTIEIASDEGTKALPAGTVFRVKNGFVGRLKDKIEGGKEDQQYLVLEENKDRREHSESRFHATLTDEKPNADCNGAYCRVTFKVANSDAGEFDTVYLRSTSVSKTAADDFERRLSEIVQKIQKHLKETDNINPHVSALLLHDLMSFSKLQTLVDTKWVEALRFHGEFFAAASACKIAWDSCRSDTTTAQSPNKITQLDPAKLLKWLDEYQAFFKQNFEDFTWIENPEALHEGFSIASTPVVTNDYTIPNAIAVHSVGSGFTNAPFKKFFELKISSGAKARLYIRSTASPEVLLFPSDANGVDPGRKRVVCVKAGKHWYFMDVHASADIDEKDSVAILSDQNILQIHVGEKSENEDIEI